MFGKSRTLALAVATAGLIGMSGPMASASTPGGGDSGGLLNISHNQVPIEVCNDTIPINVIGAQVPVDGLAAALGLLSPGNTVAKSDTSCHENTGQVNGHTMAARWGCTTCGAPAVLDDDPGGDSGGLANVSHNQVPIEACDITVPINGIGLQVPLDHIAGGLGILSPGDTVADQDSSCNSDTGQANG
jgi:hypothetical protein